MNNADTEALKARENLRQAVMASVAKSCGCGLWRVR